LPGDISLKEMENRRVNAPFLNAPETEASSTTEKTKCPKLRSSVADLPALMCGE
jgi:hypothetical protein